MVNLAKLNFYSGSNYMKRDVSGGTVVLALPAYGATTSYTVTHNLGYIPFFQVFCEQDGAGIIWSATKINLYTETSLSHDPPDPTLRAYATTTTLVISLDNTTSPTATGNRPIYFLIYKDYGNV